MTLQELSREARSLSVEKRGELVEELILSLDESPSPTHHNEWVAELNRRREDVRSGRVLTIDGNLVAEKVRALLSV